MKTGALLTIEKTIPAPPAAVFQAWLDPRALAIFMCPGPGASVTKADADPRVGGRFRIVMRVGGQDLPHEGEYQVIDRHHRLEFTWESPAAPPGSQVTLTFGETEGPLGKKHTLLKLVHRGLPTDQARQAHDQGWTTILNNLAALTSAGQ